MGLLTIFNAFWVDIRSRNTADYAFWLYIFGVIAFWCGLTMQHSDSELGIFMYFCINLGLIGIGAVLDRRVFVVFGTLGCAGYCEHLASSILEDSWLFPIALTVIGLLVAYLGVVWQRNEVMITTRVRKILPAELRELLSQRGVAEVSYHLTGNTRRTSNPPQCFGFAAAESRCWAVRHVTSRTAVHNRQ